MDASLDVTSVNKWTPSVLYHLVHECEALLYKARQLCSYDNGEFAFPRNATRRQRRPLRLMGQEHLKAESQLYLLQTFDLGQYFCSFQGLTDFISYNGWLVEEIVISILEQKRCYEKNSRERTTG